MAKKHREKRTFSLENAELRFDSDAGKIIGYAAVYNQEAYGERVAPGAFTKTLQESKDIKGLYNHDMNIVLGSTAANTMTLEDTERGLRYEIDPPSWADNIKESIERGDIAGSSFGFYPIRTSRVENEAGRTINQIDEVALIDVGPVTRPWYDQTTTGLRDLTEAQVREFKLQEADAEVCIGDIIDEWHERKATTNEPEPVPTEPTQEPEYIPKPLSVLRQKLELKRKALKHEQ